jgi:hypothetical protein
MDWAVISPADMKDLNDLNYYEILEVDREATSLEIRQAYSEALAVYNEDSIVTYSLFSVDQRRGILAAIEEAYTVLSDKKTRMEYDQKQFGQASRASETDASNAERPPLPKAPAQAHPDDIIRQRVKALAQTVSVKQQIETIKAGDQISGRQLAELREALGLDHQQVYRLIRMSSTVIKAIEKDDVAALPQGIYLKGFLKAYAEILQLDPGQVIEAYLKNVRALSG